MNTGALQPKSILLTTPNQHWLHTTVVRKAVAMMQDGRYRLRWSFPCNRPFEATLQDCVDEFINGGFDYWVSMDDDNPPENNPLDLIELDRDIIGCPTPVYHNTMNGEFPIYWNAYQFDKDNGLYRQWPDRVGLQKVDAIGTGCFVIARRVFEGPLRYGAFQRKWVEGRVARGNDLAFCERARTEGWEVYAHFDYPAEHMVTVPLNELCRAVNQVVG